METDDGDDFKNEQQDIECNDQHLYGVWRPDRNLFKVSDILKREPTFFRKLNRRTRRMLSLSSGYQKCFLRKKTHEFPAASSAVSLNIKNEIKTRQITTIPEEVFHYKRHSKSISAFKEKKNYQEKVASLTVAVGRLKEMCFAKPEVLQDTVPEEVMKLFSRIEIQ